MGQDSVSVCLPSCCKPQRCNCLDLPFFAEEYHGLTGVLFFFVDLTSGEIQPMKENRL